ncbi:MAG: OmpA family protein [Mucilaginibacter sp.]|nr:OmpA family protein [Mucilaginibacter sp.]
MRLRSLLFPAILCKAFTVSAQTDTLRVHFAINSSVLRTNDKKLIDSLVLNCYSVKSILGYADYLGTATGNQILSEQRAEAVKTYFKTIDLTFDTPAYGMGMIKNSVDRTLGNPNDRRVDIIALRPAPVAPPSLKPTTQDSLNENFKRKIEELGNLSVGDALQFSELNFYGGRHILTRQSMPYLDILLDYLRKHTDIKIEIQGHVCCSFNVKDGYDFDSHDSHLSVNRAKAIFDYLAGQGIKKSRMRYRGFGATKPKIYPEQSKADEDANRRVEIVITAKSTDTDK